MRRKVLVTMPLLLLAWVVFSAVPGLGQCLPSAPANCSDSMNLYLNGVIQAQAFQIEGNENTNPLSLPFAPIPGHPLANPLQFGNAVGLCEALPCSASDFGPPANRSDVFGIFRAPDGSFTVAFESDGGPGSPPPDFVFAANFQVEKPGVPIDITPYIDDFYTKQGYTATFVSDGNTPEPGSIMLLGSGVLGLAGVLRRKLMR